MIDQTRAPRQQLIDESGEFLSEFYNAKVVTEDLLRVKRSSEFRVLSFSLILVSSDPG